MMKKRNQRTVAFIDCSSGISGDMMAAALIDLGASIGAMRKGISSLGLKGVRIEDHIEKRHGITGTRFILSHKEKGDEHRAYKAIRAMISTSGLSDEVKERSLDIFRRLAEAEAKIHGVPPDKVEFHEIGSYDSIADIVSVSIAIEELGLREFRASKIPLGSGSARSMHGVIPVPAPATLEILKGVPVTQGIEGYELTTPTGAAIVTSIASGFGPIPEMKIVSTGYGLGKMDIPERANVLRIIKGEKEEATEEETAWVVETNIDDMNPEYYEHVTERLFEKGALDVFIIPVLMKKGRPGVLMQVICEEKVRGEAAKTILEETTSLGVRMKEVRRIKLSREEKLIDTSLGKVKVKFGTAPSGRIKIHPEYEDLKRIAKEKNLSMTQVHEEVFKCVKAKDKE